MQKDDKIRIQKFLADCGVASRRRAELLILQGSVKINGSIAKIGDKINPSRDNIRVGGKLIESHAKTHYVMLYKPRGVVSTMSDERGRRCLTDLLQGFPDRIYPVGRLDRDSEGLLLLTNDGDFANRIMHPSGHIPKKYRVTVPVQISDDMVTKLCTGLPVDGKLTAPANVLVLSNAPSRSVFEITLTEGRNRQIRKMCELLGLEVSRLRRVSIGSLKLGMLQPGKFRELTPPEVKALKNYTPH